MPLLCCDVVLVSELRLTAGCVLMDLASPAVSGTSMYANGFRILHTLSILTEPDIFLNICLSKMRRLLLSSVVRVHVSDEYVTTGLIIVLYIFILVSFFRNSNFISFALAYYVFFPFAILSTIFYSFYCLHSKWSPDN